MGTVIDKIRYISLQVGIDQSSIVRKKKQQKQKQMLSKIRYHAKKNG